MKKILFVFLAICFSSCDRGEDVYFIEKLSVNISLHLVNDSLANAFVSEESFNVTSIAEAKTTITFKVYPRSGYYFPRADLVQINNLPSFIEMEQFVSSRSGYVLNTLTITCPNQDTQEFLLVNGGAANALPVASKKSINPNIKS